MKNTLFISALFLLTTLTGSQAKHWTETKDELIWRGRYKNCDKGYLVSLPEGVVGHGSLPPLPNHGMLISPANPGITTEITLNESRVITVYDDNDAAELGSARAYLEHYDLSSAKESQ